MQTLLPSKFTGIIQLAFSDTEPLQKLQEQLLGYFPNHAPIEKLHITLLHQSFPKKVGVGKQRGDKLLKALYKSGGQFSVQAPMVQFDDVHVAREGGRESTYVTIREHDLLLNVRDDLLQAAGINPIELGIDGLEADRVFHVSLTNLTGNGGDSIAYPNPSSDERLFSSQEIG